MASVHEIFERLNMSFSLKKNKNVVHITFVIARFAFYEQSRSQVSS